MSWVFGDRENGLAGRLSSAPAMDVVEEKDHYLVHLDLPGLNKDEIQITFEDGILTVRGERKGESETKDGRIYRKERFSGSFERTLRLPEKVDAEKMDAALKNGVLEIRLPFVPEAQPRRIEIKG